MGIEVIIIIGVLAIGGFVLYRNSRSASSSGASGGFIPPAPAQSEPNRKKHKKDSSTAPEEPISMGPPPQPGSPSQPPQTSTAPPIGGMIGEDTPSPIDVDTGDYQDKLEEDSKQYQSGGEGGSSPPDEDDEIEDIIDPEPDIEPLNPAIDDTQTMKAVSPSDTQEMKQTIEGVPDGLLPQEIEDWMQNLEEEQQESDEELASLEDAESDEPKLDITYPDKQPVPATTAHFSAFYPKEAQAEQRYGVYIYAHADAMLEQITNDAQKFKDELGGIIPQPRTAKTSKSLEHGTKVTVLLESEEVEFEPDILTKRWHGDWTRYEFEFRPQSNLIDETIFVRASIMVMGFEIAKIKFAIDVIEPEAQVMAMSVHEEASTNPFARAKLESATTAGYDKIFISYSRKDKLIAEAFKIIQEAAGNDVFFDVDDIRTGEDWQAAIARAIDEADYLQLFWSVNSAESEWCGYELDYALNYRCQENKCREFIRPVWWLNPMPAPPDTLSHLNFRRMDFEKLMKR